MRCVTASARVRRRPSPAASPAESAAERRARRFRERDERILEVARGLVARDGFCALSMDAVAAAIGYSKGIVYLHYRSKEDVLVALAARTGRKRLDLFERAAAFRGRPRERMSAVGEAYSLFVRTHPHHFRVEQELHSAHVRARADAARKAELTACEDACKAVVGGIIRDAIAADDLVLPPGVGVDDLSLSLWSLTFGCFFLMSSDIDLVSRGFENPDLSLRRACHALLDGWGWRPLFADWDYPATYERIRREVFPGGA